VLIGASITSKYRRMIAGAETPVKPDEPCVTTL
jgi:hypothetical protein